MNYFEVLELSIDDIQDQDEATIKDLVSKAHIEQYDRTVGPYANVPRPDGLTQAQWQKHLNDAKDTLLDPGKRRKHIADITQTPEALEQSALTFPGGEEARTIPDLAALMEQEVTGQKGKGANMPKQLARLIDKNWDQAKTLLYNGFFAVWLAHVNQQQLANAATEITTNRYTDQQDIGLETFIQALDPGIGKPIPNISHPEMHLNTTGAGSQKTIHFKIKNAERGFLYGDVQLTNDIPGLQISDTNIHGEGVVTVALDGSALTAKQKHQTSLVIDTNGQNLEVPIYINHGIYPALRWLALSGVLMAVLALSTCFLIYELSLPQWVGTFILGIGIYAHWLLIVKKSFSWQKFLMPIKNFFHSQHFSTLIAVLKRISKFAWSPINWIFTQYQYLRQKTLTK